MFTDEKKPMKVLLALYIIILSTNAYAYIDPGTGAVIIGSLWPLIAAFFAAAIAFIVKHFWHPIKRKFKGGRKNK